MNTPASQPDEILQVHGLRAGHGQLVAVRGVSFALQRGECVALIGANGAGKTTLLRCLAGVHPATAGQVHLAGQDISSWPPRAGCTPARQRSSVVLPAPLAPMSATHSPRFKANDTSRTATSWPWPARRPCTCRM